MPGLHLRTDHVFRLGGSVALPRGDFAGGRLPDWSAALPLEGSAVIVTQSV